MRNSDRLRHPLYRCSSCGRILTRHEIVGKWQKLEESGTFDASICVCGSRKVNPTNPKLWEELFLPRVWKEAWLLRTGA